MQRSFSLSAMAAAATVIVGAPAFGQGVMRSGAQVGAMHSRLHTLKVVPQNGSAESGTVSLQQTTDGLVVKIDVAGASGEQPADIAKGTCDDADRTPKYQLTPVSDGKSTSTLSDPTIYSLMRGTYAITIRKSADDPKTSVACTDLVLVK